MSRKNRRYNRGNRRVTRGEGKYTLADKQAREQCSTDAAKRICCKCEFSETKPNGDVECEVFHCPFGIGEESA